MLLVGHLVVVETVKDKHNHSNEARQSRGSEIANVTARGKAKNQQIIDVVQRELELAYRDPAAAAHRIFKDYV